MFLNFSKTWIPDRKYYLYPNPRFVWASKLRGIYQNAESTFPIEFFGIPSMLPVNSVRCGLAIEKKENTGLE